MKENLDLSRERIGKETVIIITKWSTNIFPWQIR